MASKKDKNESTKVVLNKINRSLTINCK